MFKREMNVNLKSFIIWLSILIGMFFVVFLIYPYIINSDSIKMMDEMVGIFPEEVLKAFNMDLTSIDTAFGWLKTEGFIFVLLLTGVYSSILGSNIVLKEESDKTIEYINTLKQDAENYQDDTLQFRFSEEEVEYLNAIFDDEEKDIIKMYFNKFKLYIQ